jgi:hypothetical protein
MGTTAALLWVRDPFHFPPPHPSQSGFIVTGPLEKFTSRNALSVDIHPVSPRTGLNDGAPLIDNQGWGHWMPLSLSTVHNGGGKPVGSEESKYIAFFTNLVTFLGK